MTAQLRPPSGAACPGCLATPQEAVRQTVRDARIALSLPSIHCQSCISAVEGALNAQPGVIGARVNLTLKRAMIEAAPDLRAADLIAVLEGIGYEAHELDPGTLSATENDRAGRDLLMRLAVAGFASMNVMLLSVSVWSGAGDATRRLEDGVRVSVDCARGVVQTMPQ